jgi:hypothetical protein
MLEAGSMMVLSGGSRPITASELTDLPLPDSPTSATVLLRGTLNEMPLTASNVVFLVQAEGDAQVAHFQQVILVHEQPISLWGRAHRARHR